MGFPVANKSFWTTSGLLAQLEVAEIDLKLAPKFKNMMEVSHSDSLSSVFRD
jgi:hypothetical protein